MTMTYILGVMGNGRPLLPIMIFEEKEIEQLSKKTLKWVIRPTVQYRKGLQYEAFGSARLGKLGVIVQIDEILHVRDTKLCKQILEIDFGFTEIEWRELNKTGVIHAFHYV